MSGIFTARPKIVQAVKEHARPDPRDEASRTEAERMRRSGENRGRQSTVLTRSLNRVTPAQIQQPRRTVIGSGGP